MKIVIVRTAATEIDGSQYNLQEVGLATALARKGHECDIVYYTKGRERRSQSLSVGDVQVVLHHWPGKNIAGDAWFSRDILSFLDRFDVIQVSEYNRLFSWYLYSRKGNVVVYHGPYGNAGCNLNSRLHECRDRLFDMLFCRKRVNEGVVVLAKSRLAMNLLETKGFELVRNVGVGLDAENFKLREPIRKKARYTLLSIGRFHENKNQLFLIEVFRRCLEMEGDLELVVVGSGSCSYAEKVKETLRYDSLASSGKIRWIDHVDQEGISAYYRAADIFVLPSTYEIFGMVLLEAGWFSCPIVASRNGGSDTLISSEEHGLVIEGFSADDWAGAIVNLLHDNRRREKMSILMRRRIEERYTWDALAAAFLDAYEKAMEPLG